MGDFRLDARPRRHGWRGWTRSADGRGVRGAGANVVVASRNRGNIQRVADGITRRDRVRSPSPSTSRMRTRWTRLIAGTVDAFGSVDVMVNNAGRWGRGHEPEDTPLEEWRIVVEQNLTGMFIPCLAAGRQMIEQGGGKIINISSTAGSKGNPGQLHYSAAKAGVISLSNNLAMKWARHNINVNCILPGLIATEELKGLGIIRPRSTRRERRAEAPPYAHPGERCGPRAVPRLPGIRRHDRRTVPDQDVAPLGAVLDVGDAPAMNQLTIRGFDDELAEYIRRLARREGFP